MSLGVSVDIVRAAVDAADLVLAEVNPLMPRTHGDSFLPVSKIDRLVPVERPLLELSGELPGDIEAAIGCHVASLVPNGATLQTGIGSIPDAVLHALSEEMQELVDSDYELNMGIVACDPELGDLIGMSRYDVDPATRLAEIAFVVRDNWQGRGVGTLLMKRMSEIARARGLAGFSADVLARN